MKRRWDRWDTVHLIIQCLVSLGWVYLLGKVLYDYYRWH